ncbi:MAG: hypothetical protein HGB35_07940 [Geobacteraceae bacterium]|nr:hypothetical protein [Geobacteraceae bacterium]
MADGIRIGIIRGNGFIVPIVPIGPMGLIDPIVEEKKSKKKPLITEGLFL